VVRRFTVLALVALAAGCGDATAPQDAFSGFYKLVTVDGINVPTTVTGNDIIAHYPLNVDTLLLDAQGHFDDEPVPDSGQRIGLQGTWGFRGDSVFFFESTIGAEAAKAKLTGTSLSMRTEALHIFPNHDFVYVKIQ
jgi:hypothetical protein